MAKKALFPGRQRRRAPKIEIIPMVDVMFLLLVFYILSSLALHKSNGIPVSLPQAATADAGQVSEDIVISIAKNGEYHIDREIVPAGQLETRLHEWATKHPGGLEGAKKESVIINADRGAEYHYVVEVMDDLRKLGVANFTISTDTSGKK